MAAKVGVGLLGLGTVGGGVASILQNPSERHPLVAELELWRIEATPPPTVPSPSRPTPTFPAIPCDPCWNDFERLYVLT